MVDKLNINKLRCACCNSWDNDTCFPECKDDWNKENKSLGQCAITALIVNDYLGGKIKKCEVENSKISHYYNEIEKQDIDFTRGQFDENVKLINDKYKIREDMIKTEHTKVRYELLKERVNEFLSGLDKIDLEIRLCNMCEDMIEKSNNDTTIHYGNDTKIIIVGEAPANNGWRKSGKCWYGSDGKITGSGRVMEKLLTNIGLKLEDITFVEAVKCYSIERKSLTKCKENCYEYLQRQLAILKHELILTLGDMATKSLLRDIKYKNYKEVVGKIHNMKIDELQINVLPIYYPSPISYKDNTSIFETVRNCISKEECL